MPTFSLTPPITPNLADPDLERFRREVVGKIVELQKRPGLRMVGKVVLEDGVLTPIAHRLGREPDMVLVSPPRDPSTVGMVEEVVSSSFSPKDFIVLKASGFGADVTVRVAVS